MEELTSVPQPAASTAVAAHAPATSVLVDLHSHSRYSDGTSSLEEIETACEKRRIGLSLTDHNEIRGAVRLSERDRVSNIPGIEVGTKEGLEFLIYFSDPGDLERYYTRAVEPHLLTRFMVRSKAKSLAVIDEAHEEGGYVSLAHPFAPGRKSIDFHRRRHAEQDKFVDEVLRQVDALELFNGGILNRSNVRADEFRVGVDKHLTAGSDSHHVSSLGSCGIRFCPAAQPRSADLFQCLSSNGGTEIVTRQGKHFRTVPIIAFKHTLFFVRGRKANGRKVH